ncbi:MAG TPA: ATP-binding protein, partial [Blastocatellia bacterium]
GGRPIEIDLNDDMPLVRIDVRLVAEVVINLIENAAKYSPPGTAIRLGARFDADRLFISITNEGPGISTADIGRVFDKFYRGSLSSTKNITGTGMGLAIARGIVEAHGGAIEVTSRPGSGATFEFWIPTESKEVLETIGENTGIK